MRMKQRYHLQEREVDQGDLGSGTTKPRTLGTNLRLVFPKIDGVQKKRRIVDGKTKEQVVKESQSLSRWTPVMTSVTGIYAHLHTHTLQLETYF